MADPRFQTFSSSLQDAGLVARYANDRAPDKSFVNLRNLEARQENAISSRFGRKLLTTNLTNNFPLPGPVHTLARLKALFGNTYRYAMSGTGLYRATGDNPQQFLQINQDHLFSGNRVTPMVYRPDFSSVPYMFFADALQMLKDNGTFSDTGTVPTQQWGIFAPTIPPTLELEATAYSPFDTFELSEFSPPSVYSYSNLTGLSPVTIAAAPTGAVRISFFGPWQVTITTTSPHGFVVGQAVTMENITDASFDGTYIIATTPSPTTFTYLQNGAFAPATSGSGTVSLRLVPIVSTNLPTGIPAAGVTAAVPASMANIVVGMILDIDSGAQFEQVLVTAITGINFTAFFTMAHAAGTSVIVNSSQGTVAASTVATLTRVGALDLSVVDGAPAPPATTYINFFAGFDVPTNVFPFEILFDVGDGSFTDTYSRVYTPTAFGLQNFFAQAGYTENGKAGQIGHTWADVTAYRISITTSGPVQFTLASMYLTAAGGPDSSTGGTSPYDYRYTYFNINTGAESNPSTVLAGDNFVSPVMQPILITWTASPDPQVTHVRIYRRGGTLNDGWLRVAQVPIGMTSYVDNFTDADIASATPLDIDNDVPVTSTLSVPIDIFLQAGVTIPANEVTTVVFTGAASTVVFYPNQQVTVGTEDNQEVVYLIAGGTGQFTAFFQNDHEPGAEFTASTRCGTPVNLGAIAYQQAWLAGDPANPHILYYSKPESPEAFPPENTLEIGTPDQPIMAVIYFSGQLFVFTTATVWLIFAPGPNIPNPIPTGVRHGLASNFGWAAVEGGLIYYQSFDGIYACQGFGSTYISKAIEWLPRGDNLGPVLPYDLTQLNNVLMAFRQNEVFVSYPQIGGGQGRIAFDTTYQRWRNDDVGATAMLNERDTDNLIIGLPNGNVYIDRVGDFDDGGYAGGVQTKIPIAFNLQTPAMDQNFLKNEKVYQELTLDINTNGQNVTATLLFDNGQTVVPISTTINTSERGQVCLNINQGAGQRSLNVALLLTASVTQVVDLFEYHIRAEVDAERRQSFDTYWQKYGTDEWKMMKQAWLEYETPGGQPITFNVYFDGSATPNTQNGFPFTLPAVTLRTTKRLRFPPVKFSTVRFIATSPGDFKIYTESFTEIKMIAHDKGYFKSKLDDARPQEQ
jgi:hypothetical protein